MDLTPTPMQEEFRTASVNWLADNMPLDQARARPANLWAGIADMGWLAMTAPEMGLDHATEALVFAELGRFLAPVGAMATAVAARWVGTSGKIALALPSGNRLRVFDPEGASAALGLWDGEPGIAALPDGLTGTPSLDLSTTQAVLDPAPAPKQITDPRAALHLRLLTAAYGVGCADAARDMAADYAKIREQFERQIGWFQAIKHICADMVVRSAVARSQLYFAACALDANAPDAAFHVAAAKRLADTACLENGRANIQVHGGIGMTDEAAPHLCLKRAHLLGFIAPVSSAELLDAQPS
jgi:alkylation response protein AidB-like acyl-CoA dehydrogenase